MTCLKEKQHCYVFKGTEIIEFVLFFDFVDHFLLFFC